MSEIKIIIDDRYLQAFLAFLKTLNYVEVSKVSQDKSKTIASSPDVNGNFLANLPPDSLLRQAVKPTRKNVTADELIRESGNVKTDLEILRQLAIELDIQQSTEELLAQLQP